MTTPTPIPMRERLRMDYGWTARQKQVLELIARGRSNTEIAEALGVSLAGAKWHVSEILSKLQADQREEAAEYWRRYNGLAPRFSRIFRGIAGALTTKWIAGSAAGLVAGIACGALILAFATSDESTDSPTAAVSSPTVPPEPSSGRTAPVLFGVSSPQPLPQDLVLLYTRACPVCSPEGLFRAWTTAGGALQTEQVWGPPPDTKLSFITAEKNGQLRALVCRPWGACDKHAPEGERAQATHTTLLSLDGGVSWNEAPLNPDPRMDEVLELQGTASGWQDYDGNPVDPRLGADAEEAVAGAAYLWLREEAGSVLATWRPFQFAEQLRAAVFPATGSPADVFELPGGFEVARWDGGHIAHVHLRIGPEKAGGLDGPRELFNYTGPAQVDFSTGTITPYAGLGPDGNYTHRLVGVAVGPFHRVATGGDCLNVREEASTGATSLACYRDGVLLRDLGGTAEADGVTWLKVATPDGREGWASAEFLKR